MKERKKSAEKEERNKRSAQRDALHAKNWKEYTATVDDIRTFLGGRVFLRHNVITGRVEYRWPDSSEWQPVTDRVVNSLWAELSRQKVVRAQDIYRVIESDFVPEFHPFRFYLEHLPPWDGLDHLLAMSVTVSVKGDVMNQMRFAEYLKRWFVGMVAGWVDPKVVNNVILVLIGEQGMFMSVARAMQIVSANISQKLSPVHLGRALGELGFQRVKHGGVRGYIVVCRSGDEMQAAQRSMAAEASADEGTVDSKDTIF